MTSESTYPELTTLKVVHNGIARRVKIPYDMDWKSFERKVCHLFNINPPLVTSYKDSMGVSVLVDNSEDFFFFLDEEYTGRLDIVTLDVPESSEWTVVRTDTGKALKEADDPTEVNDEEIHALNSPRTTSSPGSIVNSPLFTSTKDHLDKNPDYTGSEKSSSLSHEPELSCSTEAKDPVEAPSLDDVSNLADASSTHSTSESINSSPANSTKEIDPSDVINTEQASSNGSSTSCFEVKVENESEVETEGRSVNSDSNSLNIDNGEMENSFNVYPFKIFNEPNPFSKENNPENSKEQSNDVPELNNPVESSKPRDEFSALVDLSSQTLQNIIKSVSSVADTLSAPVTTKSNSRDELNQESEQSPEEEICISESPDPISNENSTQPIQDLRQLCFRYGDTFRRHPSLLMTMELFTDQLINGIPIDVSILEQSLTKFSNSSAESVLTPSEAFEDLATNLAGSVSQLIQHVGDTFSTFIERDVVPLVTPLRHNQGSGTNPPESQSHSNQEDQNQTDPPSMNHTGNGRSTAFKSRSDGHRCHKHHHRNHRGQGNDTSESIPTRSTTALASRKCFRGYHSKLTSRDNWLDSPRSGDTLDSHSRCEPVPNPNPNPRLVDYTPEPKEDFVGSNPINADHPAGGNLMRERRRPASHTPVPQIMPYYIDGVSSSIDDRGLKVETESLSTAVPEREAQLYRVANCPLPYRPMSFKESIRPGFDAIFSNAPGSFPSTGGPHPIQICPARPANTPREPIDTSYQVCSTTKPVNVVREHVFIPSGNQSSRQPQPDLGKEIDPADVVLIEGLVTLRSMGFPDDSANLEALQLKQNVSDAVDHLLNQ